MKKNKITYSITCSINGIENTVSGEIGEKFFSNMEGTVYSKEDLIELARDGMESTINYVIYNISKSKEFCN